MDYVKFGGTGLRVSRLCLGTMTFGVQCDEARSVAILNAAAEAGVDFLDTADVYPLGGDLRSAGQTEEIIGRWLKGKRHDYVLATKCGGAMGRKAWQRGASRQHVLEAIDASLRRLGTDYIDLYQIHFDDPATPLDETLDALDTVVRAGKARYVGVSNWPAYKVARALGRSELKNLVRIDSVQPRYNLLFRTFERDLLPMCADEDIAVIPYNPLAGGFLTGKHDRAAPPPAGRFSLGTAGALYQERYWQERQFDAIETLRTLAAEWEMSLATLAVRWVLSNPAVTSPIIGASRVEQLADSFAAGEQGPLPADLKGRLDEVTHGFRAIDMDR
jgi:aryl-alcohol dehydrogenase-like predicted oxidoreductase